MKTILIISSIFLIAAASEPSAMNQSSRCESLRRAGFLFLKDFDIKVKEDRYFEYSYVLTKGTTYEFALCFPDAGPNHVSTDLTLYNDGRRVVLEKALRYPNESVVYFQCSTTGIHYVRIESNDPTFRGGTSAMSFHKERNPGL